MKVCVSIAVHENPEVIRDQLLNIRHYYPDCSIILHLSFSALELFSTVDQICRALPDVYLNPQQYPTQWGWMFHTHLFNFKYARELGLDFSYFLIDASQSLYIKHGAAEYFANFDFLSNCKHIDSVRTSRHSGTLWVAQAACADRPFINMCEQLDIKDVYLTAHEGTAYKRDLFEEMVEIFDFFYQFRLSEKRYPREEIFFSTLARHLSPRWGLPLTYLGRFMPPIGYFKETGAYLQSFLKSGTAEQDPFVLRTPFAEAYWKHFYAIRVARTLDHPLRVQIREHIAEEQSHVASQR